MRRQSTNNADINIGVITGDIDVSMMDDGVFPKPGVGTDPHQVHGSRHELVDPEGLCICLVSSIMRDIESYSSGGQSEQNGQR
jgi:hypothetical protein